MTGFAPPLWLEDARLDDVEVVVALGQSNQRGKSSTDSGTSTTSWVYRGIAQTALAPPVVDPVFGATDTTFSSWPAFIRAREALGKRVVLITVAYGGTALAVDAEATADDGDEARWDPTAGRALAPGTGLTEVAGDLHRAFLDAVEVLEAAFGRPVPITVVHWNQGEKEGGRGSTLERSYAETYALYYAALYDLVTAIWEDVGAPVMVSPTSLFEAAEDEDITATYQPVHDAQLAVVAAHPHCYLGGSQDDLDLVDPPSDIHIEDQNTLGTRNSAALTAAGL